MKRLLALTLLTTAISVPAFAETSLNTGSSTGLGIGVNTGVADTSVGADVDAGASVSGSSSSDTNSSSQAEQDSNATSDSSTSNSSSISNESTARTETSATGQAIAGDNLARNDVVMIQQALRQEGFYNGTADGVWGPRTASALMQFQQQNKLGATGHLNTNTLDRLGIELGASGSASSSTGADVNSNNRSTIDSSEGVGSSANPGSGSTY
ncbi:MAG: peptidoglycan-binding domain-containing protein [Alphaproteobacteria bacterium]